MVTQSRRQLSFGQNIKKILAGIFLSEQIFGLHEPGEMITVSEVRLSPDLRHATCYISYFNTRAQREGACGDTFFEKINMLRGAIRHVLAQQLQAKFVPSLTFKPDETYAQVQRIDTLLKEKR